MTVDIRTIWWIDGHTIFDTIRNEMIKDEVRDKLGIATIENQKRK